MSSWRFIRCRSGLAVVPSAMADGRATGLYDYFRSLPIPALIHLFAQAVILSALAIPGAVASLGVAALRFNIQLQPSRHLPSRPPRRSVTPSPVSSRTRCW